MVVEIAQDAKNGRQWLGWHPYLASSCPAGPTINMESNGAAGRNAVERKSERGRELVTAVSNPDQVGLMTPETW